MPRPYCWYLFPTTHSRAVGHRVVGHRVRGKMVNQQKGFIMKKTSSILPLLMLLSCLSLILTGCGKKNIEGVVKDPFGQGLEGVSVQVDKTTFSATTSKSGQYAIDYVPGTILLKFSKQGYSSHSLELNIQQKAKYPAEPVLLYPIPGIPGIFWIGEKNLTEMPGSPVSKHRYATSWMDPNHYRYEAVAMKRLCLKPGPVEFIDAQPDHYALVRLKDGGQIQEFSNQFGTIKFVYNGIMQDNGRKLAEAVYLRSADLQSGYYAWVCMAKELGGKYVPNETKLCYPFWVDSSATGEVVACQ
jgi:hypothetical protein